MEQTWEGPTLMLIFYMHFTQIQNNLVSQNNSLQNYELYSMEQKREINPR